MTRTDLAHIAAFPALVVAAFLVRNAAILTLLAGVATMALMRE